MSFVVTFPSLPRFVAVLALGLSTLALVGCGGGGSSSVDPPSAPTNVQVTAQDAAVTLTWEGRSAASGYNVYRATSAGVGASGTPVNGSSPVGQLTFTDPSVENGTRYYYRVTAVGEGGESEPSAEVSIRPFPSPPPRP